MKRLHVPFCLCATILSCAAQGTITVEPDSFPNGAVLNTVAPGVSLITAGANNLPIPPVSFDVTATLSIFPFQPPTGSNVFAHAGVPFWNDNRRLRMDFAALVTGVSVDFQGGNSLNPEVGMLQVFNDAGALLDSYSTAPRLGGHVETMAINRASADISWAVAWTAGNTFGRLDQLIVTVPEPSTMLCCGVGLALLALARSRVFRRELPRRTGFQPVSLNCLRRSDEAVKLPRATHKIDF